MEASRRGAKSCYIGELEVKGDIQREETTSTDVTSRKRASWGGNGGAGMTKELSGPNVEKRSAGRKHKGGLKLTRKRSRGGSKCKLSNRKIGVL